ncbi:aminopeptidase [Stetteria hydrogenophila]
MRGVDRFARLLVDYCVSVGKGDEVLVSAGLEAIDLVREVYRAVVERGGYPRFELRDEVLQEAFYRYAPEELLDYVSDIDVYVMERINALIGVNSARHAKPLIGVDPERLKRRSRAARRLTEIFMRRDADGSLRWVSTAYPTPALAQEAGMGPLEFEDFVYRALKLHEPDPVEAWVRQAERLRRIAGFLSRVSELRVVGRDTDLLVGVAGRKWIVDDGRKNMPGGEVFTGPLEDYTEGRIYFEYPSVWRGFEVEGVRLVFRRGEVVEATAARGGEFLRKVLETDEGARRLGEAAFGLNYDITRPVKMILFDEKIGGTMHFALGASYPATGGRNQSSIHWDLVKELRRDGRVYADGDLVFENGRFIEEVIS